MTTLRTKYEIPVSIYDGGGSKTRLVTVYAQHKLEALQLAKERLIEQGWSDFKVWSGDKADCGF